MQLSGMNQFSDEKQYDLVVKPVVSCQTTHVYKRLASCSPITESATAPCRSPATTQLGNLLACTPYSADSSTEALLIRKASVKAPIENHHHNSSSSYSPSTTIVAPSPHVAVVTNASESPHLVNSSLPPSRHLQPSAVPRVPSSTTTTTATFAVEQNETECLFPTGEMVTTPIVCSSPASLPTTCLASETQLVNGSINSVSLLACPTECPPTPSGDTSFDINGRSGSHTPVSLNDSDRARMDLSKLDDTIDYVLSNARSDDPCEGMFVLSCRNREPPTHMWSPTQRANTPSSSSGHVVFSPSPSPTTPSSPHSCSVTSSPMLNSTNKTSPFQSAGAVSNVVATHSSVPRYFVDQNTGLIQLSPCSVNSQTISAQCNNQHHPVSFVHLYPDPSRIQIADRPQLSKPPCQPVATSGHQMLFRPTVPHGLQHRPISQSNHTGSCLPTGSPHTLVHRNYVTSLVSPAKINLVHTMATQLSRANTVASVPNRGLTAYSPMEAVSVQPNRAVVISPPASVCCVVQNSSSGASPLAPRPGCTTIDMGCFPGQHTLNHSPIIPTDRKAYVQSPVPVSFRQPVVPAQPVPPSCISTAGYAPPPVVPNSQTIPSSLPISSLSSSTVPTEPVNRPTGNPKRRNNASSSTASKRRKTAAANANSAMSAASTGGSAAAMHKTAENAAASHRANLLIEQFEKHKLGDVRSLVCAPVLKPYTAVFPPSGGPESTVHDLSSEDEQAMLTRKGLKYTRGALSLAVPKCFVTDNVPQKCDSYIVRHLQAVTPVGPLLRREKCEPNTHSPVCASPQPVSFENHMMALFSSMHRPDSKGEECKTKQDPEPTECKPADTTLFAEKLLPVFSTDATPNSTGIDPERSTPPLSLFHMPNPNIIRSPNRLSRLCSNAPERDDLLNNTDTRGSDSLQGFTTPTATPVPPPSGYVVSPHPSSSSSPLIDSETGELLSGRHGPSQSSASDKVHIMFDISPSMTTALPTIIRRIADSLNIDPDSVSYQITRSGAKITLDQVQSQSENLMRSWENKIREHFTPVTVRVEQSTINQNEVKHSADSPRGDSAYCRTPIQSTLDSTTSTPPPLTIKLTSDIADNLKTDGMSATGLELTKYLEEPISIVALLANKQMLSKSCQNCDKTLSTHSSLRKGLDELANLTGLVVKADVAGDFVFCSEHCMLQFTRSVSHRRNSLQDFPSASITSNDSRSQILLACDLHSTIPVVLQNGPPKSAKISKRAHPGSISAMGNAKKRQHASFPVKHRWRGTRWRGFSSDFAKSVAALSSTISISTNNPNQPFTVPPDRSSVLRLSSSNDSRICLLCSVRGDAPENSLGRLLPINVGQWLHVNCSLWCYEVYETLGGSLNNVDVWIKKALETNCTHCGELGAGLPCYNPRCTLSYHVPCAVATGCMFFTDRGMYCPQHQPREVHPMQLPSLTVLRRVYITRDENAEVGSVIHEEERTNVVRIGSVCLRNVGQLLPHQIDSGYFHTRRYIYPVGYHATRFFWSMRVEHTRSRYECEITESDGRPLFRITAIDRDMDNESVEHESCSGAWNIILSRIDTMRRRVKLIRLFPQHLKGEDLYGLSEPQIVRAVESLPAMDCLRDYVFNFGRLELIAEMPLAINPSGCARAEPKRQTYVKRAGSRTSNSASAGVRSVPLPGLRRSQHPGISSNVPADSSKQYQSSRSQQYRRLKNEVANNVILGRSRIQGFGLFAARDLEPQTMVIEYIGELIRLELANKREKSYEAQNRGIYMFRLNEDLVIDATVCGGLARYVNHSCRPNCFAEYVSFGDHSHIVIITTRHIEKGEELSYDYNFDLEDTTTKIPCLCRAPNCRQWMN